MCLIRGDNLRAKLLKLKYRITSKYERHCITLISDVRMGK
jgi:hypothetical protein